MMDNWNGMAHYRPPFARSVLKLRNLRVVCHRTLSVIWDTIDYHTTRLISEETAGP